MTQIKTDGTQIKLLSNSCQYPLINYLIPRTNFGKKGRKVFVSTFIFTEVTADVLKDHRRLRTNNSMVDPDVSPPSLIS